MQVTDERLDVTFDLARRDEEFGGDDDEGIAGRGEGGAAEYYPSLRVSGVYSESGEPLDFVQEGKERRGVCGGPAAAAKAGDTVRLLTGTAEIALRATATRRTT